MKIQPPANVNSVSKTPIVLLTPARLVRIQETAQGATTDYQVFAPGNTDGPKTVAAGREFPLTVQSDPGYRQQPNDVGKTVGYIQTVSGSVNFDVTEE